MNVLILNWRDPDHPLAGGAEKMLFEHSKYWSKMGAKVSWYSSKFKNAKEREKKSGISFIRSGNQYTTQIIFFLKYISGDYRGFDLIIDCFHFIPFFTPIYVFNKRKIAIIHEVAGKVWFKNIIFPLSLLGYLIEPLFFIFYRKLDFITVSNSTKRDLIKFRIKSDKIHVIYNGVDKVKIIGKKEKYPTILYLGTISKDKGFEDASLAVSLIKKKIPNLNFWIAGKEQKKGDFNWYIGTSIKFTKYFGFVSDIKKFELLKKAWILIHPSTKEGWGLTVIEAATQGTPTLGYNVPGLRDSVKDGRTGILTTVNYADLADAGIRLLKNKQLLRKMSDDAILNSKKFDWEKSGIQSWKLINS